MSREQNDFGELLARIRAGDANAIRECVRHYEPLIRREVRMCLRDPRLWRVIDSLDISQDVFASFFHRASDDQFELDELSDMTQLIMSMARNKARSLARREYRDCRDVRRLDLNPQAIDSAFAHEDSAEEQVESLEMADRVHELLSADERQLARLRGEGMSWGDIACQFGGTPSGRRMQLFRAMHRVREVLSGILPITDQSIPT